MKPGNKKGTGISRPGKQGELFPFKRDFQGRRGPVTLPTKDRTPGNALPLNQRVSHRLRRAGREEAVRLGHQAQKMKKLQEEIFPENKKKKK